MHVARDARTVRERLRRGGRTRGTRPCRRESPDPLLPRAHAGSELYFTGFQKLRFPPIAAAQRRMPVGAETREVCAPCHSGRALLHLGCHPHRTVKIESGERYNWVLWYHDTEELDAARARREGAGAAPPASAAAVPALARVAAPAEEGVPPQPAWASRTPPPPSPAAET